MTDTDRLAALPCGYEFTTGGYCGTSRFHPIHLGGWPGPEPQHEYQPNDRRSGRDRRIDPRPAHESLLAAIAALPVTAISCDGGINLPDDARWLDRDAVFAAIRAALEADQPAVNIAPHTCNPTQCPEHREASDE